MPFGTQFVELVVNDITFRFADLVGLIGLTCTIGLMLVKLARYESQQTTHLSILQSSVIKMQECLTTIKTEVSTLRVIEAKLVMLEQWVDRLEDRTKELQDKTK